MIYLFLPGMLIGYLLWAGLSHPQSSVNRRVPRIDFGKRIQVLPKVKIFYRKDKALHCHHWLLASVALILFLIFLPGLLLIKGFLVGTIGQGLSYHDRFHLTERQER